MNGVLPKEGFDCLVALLGADLSEIDGLKLKRGRISVVREAIRRLQTQQQKDPQFSETKRQRSTPDPASSSLSQLLGSLTLGPGHGNRWTTTAVRRCVTVLPHC